MNPPLTFPPPALPLVLASRVPVPHCVDASPIALPPMRHSILPWRVLPLHPKQLCHWGSPSHSDLCCNFSSFTLHLPTLQNHYNVPCCVHIRMPVSTAKDPCIQSAPTRTENKTRTRESNRANVWLQTSHKQEDQQQITFPHKCPIIKFNVQSFTIPFPMSRPKFTSSAIP